MRRHLSLTLSLALVIAGAAAAGIAPAGASSRPHVVPHTVEHILAGSSCKSGAIFCFQPKAKKIASGTRVNFTNQTIAPHTVTRCDAVHCSGVGGGTGTDSGFGSAVINGGAKYSFVFHGAGTYVFYCSIHGYTLMHATITVT